MSVLSQIQDALLEKLFNQKTFLRQPMSEQAIANDLGFNKSTVREILSGLYTARSIEQVQDGTARPILQTDNILQGHGLWLALSGAVIKKIVNTNRLTVSTDLNIIIKRQKAALSAGNIAEWVKTDFEFQQTLMDKAGMDVLTPYLRQTLMRLRIGSALIETPEQQQAITSLNEKLIKLVAHGSVENLMAIQEERIKTSLTLTLEAIGADPSDHLWQAVKDMTGISNKTISHGCA